MTSCRRTSLPTSSRAGSSFRKAERRAAARRGGRALLWYSDRMKAQTRATNTFTAVFQKGTGGYTAWLEEMPNVISEGKTRAEAARNLRDALGLMLETNRILSFKDAGGDVERLPFSFPVQVAA